MRQIKTYVDARDGKVILHIMARGKRLSISTPMSSTEKFNSTDVPRSVVGWKTKSATLRQWYADCEEYLRINQGKPVDSLRRGLRAIVNGVPDSGGDTLAALMREFAATKIARNTQAAYTCTAKNVEKFDPKATPSAITPEWLRRFEAHERAKGRMVNGIAIDLRNIRALFNWLLEDDRVSHYPFRKFHIHHEQTRKRNLSVADLRTIIAHGGRYTDTFALMFYLMGININDLYYLTPDSIRDGRLEYRRNKTGRLFSVKIEPEAAALIDRYRGTRYLLSFAETCADYHNFLKHMNDTLKDIIPGCTSYWSRHTWASMAAETGSPIEIISAALGHSVGASVTNIYIAYDIKKVDEANRRVIDHIHEH